MFGLKKKSDNECLKLKDAAVAALKQVYDPEIPVNIYDLGLIYDISINDKHYVHVQMTLTTPGCPVAQTFPGIVEQAILKVEGVVECSVELVWDPPWTQDRMTEAARLELGLFF
jgi:FeS assembly SUF system protein